MRTADARKIPYKLQRSTGLYRYPCKGPFTQDLSAVCQHTKAVHLLKSETATESHRASWIASQTTAINCLKSHWNRSSFTFWSRNFSATKIVLSCATNIPCVNGPWGFLSTVTRFGFSRARYCQTETVHGYLWRYYTTNFILSAENFPSGPSCSKHD